MKWNEIVNDLVWKSEEGHIIQHLPPLNLFSFSIMGSILNYKTLAEAISQYETFLDKNKKFDNIKEALEEVLRCTSIGFDGSYGCIHCNSIANDVLRNINTSLK